MRICLVYLGLFVLVISCAKEDKVKCDGAKEVDAINNTILKVLLSNSDYYRELGMNDIDNFVDDFFNDFVKIKFIRTVDLDNELYRCDCSAQLDFRPIETTFKNEFPEEYESRIILNFMTLSLSKMIKTEISKEKIFIKTSEELVVNFDYAIQKLNSGELIVEYEDDIKFLSAMLFLHYWDRELNGNSTIE